MFRRTRRNSKPEPFWRDLLDRWKASGESVVTLCAAHRVSPATFYAWRERLAASRSRMVATSPAFAALRVVPNLAADVVLPSGLVVRVPRCHGPGHRHPAGPGPPECRVLTL
jgi:hypothetical protein